MATIERDLRTTDAAGFSSIEDAIAAIARGEIVVVVDDPGRENEGDFVMAAELVTPERVNFMVTHGRGIVCMPVTSERAHELAYLYLRRWHIETGYRIKNKLRVRTCSPHAGIRRFLQYFSILTHNLWMLQRWLARSRERAIIVTVRLFQFTLGKLVCERAL